MNTVVIPAIDLRNGAVVRLRQGDYAQQTTFEFEPRKLASRYYSDGARWLHVVDLDGARSGNFENLDVIAALTTRGLNVQAGGGVRDRKGLERLFDVGVSRAVVGSIAVRQPEEVADWLRRYGSDRITIALDTRYREGRWQMPHAGWTETGGSTLDELAPFFENAGARHVLCTDIDRDGMMAGPNLELYRHLAMVAPKLKVQASGGVRSADDVAQVAAAGMAGVILGRALLEGAMTLTDALSAAQPTC